MWLRNLNLETKALIAEPPLLHGLSGSFLHETLSFVRISDSTCQLILLRKAAYTTHFLNAYCVRPPAKHLPSPTSSHLIRATTWEARCWWHSAASMTPCQCTQSTSCTCIISCNPMRLGPCLRKWRHQEVHCLAQGHAAVKWESLPSSAEPVHAPTHIYYMASPGISRNMWLDTYMQFLWSGRNYVYTTKGWMDQDRDLFL